MVANPDLTKNVPPPVAGPVEVPSEPMRRRPGRPRKNALPEVTPDTVAAETVATASDTKPEPPPRVFLDDRIGMDVHPLAEAIGFDDGRTYRCHDGKIVERLT